MKYILYPVIMLFTNVYAMVMALKRSLVLFNGECEKYTHFNFNAAINMFYYWKIYDSIIKYGRFGVSPYVCDGEKSNGDYFFHTMPSLMIFRYAGAASILFSMAVWLGGFTLWLASGVSVFWLVILLALTLFSVSFYWNTFSAQNYNAIGFSVLPMCLFFLYNQQYIPFSLCLLLISFLSFTCAIIAIVYAFFHIVLGDHILNVGYLLPATIKIFSHLRIAMSAKEYRIMMLKLLRVLGAFHRDVKYKRKNIEFKMSDVYIGLQWLGITVVIYLTHDVFAWPLVFGISVYLFNSCFVRFADGQTPILFGVTLALTAAIQYESFWVAAAYWLLVSPVPSFYSWTTGPVSLMLPKVAPCDITPVLEDLKRFFSVARAGSKVLIVEGNPDGDYHKIFYGSRCFLESALYIAWTKSVHLFPDMHAVMHFNKEGDPEFWSDNVQQAMENVSRWQADYLLVMTKRFNTVPEEYLQRGYKVVSSLDWSDYVYGEVRDYAGGGPGPVWNLLGKAT